MGLEELIRRTSKLIGFGLRYSEDYEELRLAIHLGYNVVSMIKDDNEIQDTPTKRKLDVKGKKVDKRSLKKPEEQPVIGRTNINTALSEQMS